MVKYFSDTPVDPNRWSDLSVIEFPSKKWEDTDVEISITHCGWVPHETSAITFLSVSYISVCGSDVHTLSSGWGPVKVPLVVG